MTRLSPCVDLCRIEQPSGLCFGCARSRDEIADWPTLTENGRKEIWASLADHRPQQVLPIGVVTALVGAPAIAVILFRARRVA